MALMRLIDAQFLETPWYGSRQMARHLRRDGHGSVKNLGRYAASWIGWWPKRPSSSAALT